MSSSVRRIRRPLPRPSNGIDVRPGHAITIRSPRPAVALIMCFFRPFPNARRSETATVPQTMPKIVRNVRSFWLRRSRASCRNASLSVVIEAAAALRDFLRRTLDELLAGLEPGEDLDVQAVRDAELHLDLLRLRL